MSLHYNRIIYVSHITLLLGLVALINAIICNKSHGATDLNFGYGDNSADALLGNLRSSTKTASELVWGVVVDTGNNGFLTQYQAGFVLSNTSTLPAGQFLTNVSGSTSDDRLFIAELTMRPGFTDDSNTGPIPTTVSITYGSGVASGQALAIVWFDYTSFGSTTISGDKYGLLTIPKYTLPSDQGLSIGLGDLFEGLDPVRIANLSLSPIPEPSALLLGSLSILALLRRRR